VWNCTEGGIKPYIPEKAAVAVRLAALLARRKGGKERAAEERVWPLRMRFS